MPDCHALVSSGWPDQPTVPREAKRLRSLSGVRLRELENRYLLGHPTCDSTLWSQPGLQQCGVCLSEDYFTSLKPLYHFQPQPSLNCSTVFLFFCFCFYLMSARALAWKVNTDVSETICELQEEALQAFIQPETLDGPNQYFCERCQKKCDARKVSVM